MFTGSCWEMWCHSDAYFPSI